MMRSFKGCEKTGTVASGRCHWIGFWRGAVVVLLWGAALAADLPAAPASSRFEFVQTEMAVPIRIVLYAPDNATAAAAARAAFRRFHDLNAVCSDYNAASELRQLCEHSSPGKPIQASTTCGGYWSVPVSCRNGRRGRSTLPLGR